MKNKKIIALGLTALLGVGVAAAVGTSIGSSLAGANVECTGHHYAQVNPTLVESGVKEYWVCCEHHEIFFEQPTVGEWPTAAHEDGFKVGKDDERYISRLINENLDITYDEETGEITINDFEDYDVVYTIDEDTGDIDVTSVGGVDGFTYEVNEDGEITITGIDDIGDFKSSDGTIDLNIPEGVTEITIGDDSKYDLDGRNLGTVIIPSTVEDLGTGEDNMFYGVKDIKNIVYSGDGKQFVENMLMQILTTAMQTYYDSTSSIKQPYMPTNLWLDLDGDGEVEVYKTSSKVFGERSGTNNDHTKLGFTDDEANLEKVYCFYYGDSIPDKVAKRSLLTSVDWMKEKASFGIDCLKTFINAENL